MVTTEKILIKETLFGNIVLLVLHTILLSASGITIANIVHTIAITVVHTLWLLGIVVVYEYHLVGQHYPRRSSIT